MKIVKIKIEPIKSGVGGWNEEVYSELINKYLESIDYTDSDNFLFLNLTAKHIKEESELSDFISKLYNLRNKFIGRYKLTEQIIENDKVVYEISKQICSVEIKSLFKTVYQNWSIDNTIPIRLKFRIE